MMLKISVTCYRYFVTTVSKMCLSDLNLANSSELVIVKWWSCVTMDLSRRTVNHNEIVSPSLCICSLLFSRVFVVIRCIM